MVLILVSLKIILEVNRRTEITHVCMAHAAGVYNSLVVDLDRVVCINYIYSVVHWLVGCGHCCWFDTVGRDSTCPK